MDQAYNAASRPVIQPKLMAESQSNAPAAATRQSPRRDHFADELRGLALLGIILVNAPFAAIASVGFSDASLATPLDRAVAWAVVAFAQAKFYLLFSFLFGYSVNYFLQNAGVGPQPVFRRRLIALALLGGLHGSLLFAGDILLMYAVIGIALLWLAGRSDRAVLIAASMGIALWVWLLLDSWRGGTASAEGQAAFQGNMAALDAALAGGTFNEAFHARRALNAVMQSATAWFYGMGAFSLFCIGLVAGRHQLLRAPAGRSHWWWRGLVWGALLGLPGAVTGASWLVGDNYSFTSPGPDQLSALVIVIISAPALSAAYLSAFALLHIYLPQLTRFFRPAGRMSLTCYLGESLLLALLFSTLGLGAMGRWGAATVIALAIGIWLVLNAFSAWWLGRFAYGPVESVLRRWTHRTSSAGSSAQRG
jgi:uncharacterized protein